MPCSAAPIGGIYSHPCESARWWRFCAWPRAGLGRSTGWRSEVTPWNLRGSGRRTRPTAACSSHAWSRSRAWCCFGCARPTPWPRTTSSKSSASTSTCRTIPPAPRRASRPEAVPPLPATPDLLLAGGDVLLHDGEWRVERADVTVRGGRIQAVGRTDGRADRAATPVSVRDCRGCLVIPGLIQAHVHLCQTLFRGLADDLRLEDWLVRRIWPLEAAHTEETVYWSAMLGAAELLLGGTT